MIAELSQRLWKNDNFQRDLLALREEAIRTRLNIGNGRVFSADTIVPLLQAAATLAASDVEQHREAAYDIATATFLGYKETLLGIEEILYLTLARMGNFPAVGLAQQSDLPPAGLPVTARMETLARRMENLVAITARHSLTLTDFQKEVWCRLVAGESVSLSAPTSTGKSFVFISFLRRFASTGAGLHAVYLVPTRALINQISTRLLAYFAEDGINANRMVTVPLTPDQSVTPGTVFVLTQERLQVLLQNHPRLAFAVAIIDEAQTIADGPRGVLLHSVLDEILRRNESVQLFFAAPFLDNPDVFSTLFPRTIIPEISTATAVAQNVIFVDSEPGDRRKVNFAYWHAGTKHSMTSHIAEAEFGVGQDFAIQLAAWIGHGTQNLLYALGPSECEDMALKLREIVSPPDETAAARQVLSDFVKEAIHPRYVLAETVLGGVGFHYGDMPTLLRKTLEEHFDVGVLNYLISTSTLLHGVNLPARNLFLYRPFRGQKTPMESVDFWNLAGRAGRLGKEFSGNVFLVDYETWPSKPLSGPRRQRLVSALTRHLTEKPQDLVDYIMDRERKPQPRRTVDEFEGTFVRLFTDYRMKKLDTTLERVGLSAGSDVATSLNAAFADVAPSITLPDEVILQSPTVSVHRQQRLYDYLKKRIPQKGPEDFLPIHPLDERSYGRLLVILKRLHTYILGLSSSDQQHKYFAAIASSWMRGDPMPQIIERAFEYKKRKHPNAALATTIREVLGEIEDALRFRYVRLTSCYNAVLHHALTELKHANFADRIVSLPLYLEIGASSGSMVSLMSLGLSRISAARLTDLTTRKNMNRDEALEWLRGQKLDILPISSIVATEVRRILNAAQA